jgi:putative glutathione S-transferase
MPQPCLFATLATPEDHLVVLLRRLARREEQIDLAELEPALDQSPRPASGDGVLADALSQQIDAGLPLLWEASSQQVVARGVWPVVDALLDATDDVPSRPTETHWLDTTSALLEAVRGAGFADGPDDYAFAYQRTFELLDELEARLAEQRYLHGNVEPDVADWWLFCVLLRFDAVYYGLYKCNRRRVADYANLVGFMRDLYQDTGIADTVDFGAIKRHHFWQSTRINPKRVVPLAGETDLDRPHDRDRFDALAIGERGTEENQHRVRMRGEWVRKRSCHRERITADGSSGFPAARGRYHIYVSNNCPWSHRVTLTRKLKGLDEVISLDTLFYRRDAEHGWQFRPEEPGCTPDSLFGHRYLVELYQQVGSPERSVPVLFDKQSETIISNESAEIVRMLNDAFVAFTSVQLDLYPEPLRPQIDRLNAWIYADVNNGAYKAGFTASQQAYERAYARFFAALDRLDAMLEDSRFLLGDEICEADLRLFPTMFRFDHVYYTRMRLNQRMVRDYRHLHRWLRDMVHYPGVAEASNLDHCKKGYFGRTGNNIVPLGPDFDFGPPPSAEELARLDR